MSGRIYSGFTADEWPPDKPTDAKRTFHHFQVTVHHLPPRCVGDQRGSKAGEDSACNYRRILVEFYSDTVVCRSFSVQQYPLYYYQLTPRYTCEFLAVRRSGLYRARLTDETRSTDRKNEDFFAKKVAWAVPVSQLPFGQHPVPFVVMQFPTRFA